MPQNRWWLHYSPHTILSYRQGLLCSSPCCRHRVSVCECIIYLCLQGYEPVPDGHGCVPPTAHILPVIPTIEMPPLGGGACHRDGPFFGDNDHRTKTNTVKADICEVKRNWTDDARTSFSQKRMARSSLCMHMPKKPLRVDRWDCVSK